MLQLHDRKKMSKNALKAKRAEKMIPGVIYGNKFENKTFFIHENDLTHEMKKGNFYFKAFECELNGKKYIVTPKEIASDSVTDKVIHLDLRHISTECLITLKIPVHAINQDKCFDLQNGAVLEQKKHFITLKGKLSAMPKNLEINIETLKTGRSVLVQDIVLPKHVELLSNASDVILDITGKVRVL